MKAEIGDKWYRVEDPEQNDGPPYQRTFTVMKVTRCGVRLSFCNWSDTRPELWKFVLYPEVPSGVAPENVGDGGKRFAYPTVKMARYSWLYRKRKQLAYARHTVDKCREFLAADADGSLWERPTHILFQPTTRHVGA